MTTHSPKTTITGSSNSWFGIRFPLLSCTTGTERTYASTSTCSDGLLKRIVSSSSNYINMGNASDCCSDGVLIPNAGSFQQAQMTRNSMMAASFGPGAGGFTPPLSIYIG